MIIDEWSDYYKASAENRYYTTDLVTYLTG